MLYASALCMCLYTNFSAFFQTGCNYAFTEKNVAVSNVVVVVSATSVKQQVSQPAMLLP